MHFKLPLSTEYKNYLLFDTVQWRIYIVKYLTRAPRVQILLISCRFWGNLARSYVGGPTLEGWRLHLREILDPPLQFCHCTLKSNKPTILNFVIRNDFLF